MRSLARSLLLVGASSFALAAHAQTAPPQGGEPAGSAGGVTTLPPVTIVAPSVPPQRPRPLPTPRDETVEARPVATRRTPPRAPVVVQNPIPTQLDDVSVTQTKTEERAIDALGGTTVLSREQIDQVQPEKVSEILRSVPGVTTQTVPNDPGQAINIRGLQDFGRVNVLVDGARQNFQASGHGANGTFYLDPELIGGIDITRGPVSTIYGSGAIGGVVSFRTKGIDDILLPDERAGVVQRVILGTNGYGIANSTSLGVRLPNNAVTAFGQFVYRDAYVYRDGAGILVPQTGSEIQAGNVKLTASPADGHTLTATALIQKYDFTNRGSALTGALFQSKLDTDTYTLGYRFNPVDNPLFDLSIKGYYSTTYDDRTYLAGSLTSPTLYAGLGALPGNKALVDLKTTGFDIFNTSRFDTGPVSHALTYGGDGVFDKVYTFDQAGGYTAALTPGGHRDLTGAFVQDEMRYGGWLRAVGAARYDHYEITGLGNTFKSDGNRVSPRGTIGISPFPWLEFYGTYAEGYRAPAVTEVLIAGTHPFPAFNLLPNPNLKAETAHNVEGGVNLKFADVLRSGDVFRAKLVGFSNEVDNYISIQGVGPTLFVPVITGSFANSFCAGRARPFAFCQIPVQSQQYVNVARANISGIEAEAAYDWGDGFATLAYSNADGIGKSVGGARVTLYTLPPDKIAGSVGLRFLDRKLTVGARVVYNDVRKNYPANAIIFNTKQWTTLDLFASYDYSDWIRGDLTLANVTDVRYTKYLDLAASPGFQARGGLTLKFATR